MKNCIKIGNVKLGTLERPSGGEGPTSLANSGFAYSHHASLFFLVEIRVWLGFELRRSRFRQTIRLNSNPKVGS